MHAIELVKPSCALLPSYLDALKRGWSPDNLRPEAAQAEIVAIKRDPALFVARKADDRRAKGGDVVLPDGSTVKRLPGSRAG